MGPSRPASHLSSADDERADGDRRERVEAADGRTFDVVEPHAGETIAQVPEGSAEDVDRAVRAAARAFEGEWRTMAASDRGRLLFRFAEAVRAHEEELARLESRQVGKPIGGARWEIGQVSKVLEFYARRRDQDPGRHRPRRPAPASTSRSRSPSASSG